MTDFKQRIKELVNDGKTSEAIRMLDEAIARTHGQASPPDDELYYLRGNAYRRESNWQQALNNYLEATAINPESPAAEAHRMLMDILEFYNKDMFNQ